MTKITEAPCMKCDYPTRIPTEYQLHVCPGLVALCFNCYTVMFYDGNFGRLKRELENKVFNPVRN